MNDSSNYYANAATTALRSLLSKLLVFMRLRKLTKTAVADYEDRRRIKANMAGWHRRRRAEKRRREQ